MPVFQPLQPSAPPALHPQPSSPPALQPSSPARQSSSRGGGSSKSSSSSKSQQQQKQALEGWRRAGGLEGWRAGGLAGLGGWRGWRGVLRYFAVRIGSIGSVRGQVLTDTRGSVCDTLRFAVKLLLKQPCRHLAPLLWHGFRVSGAGSSAACSNSGRSGKPVAKRLEGGKICSRHQVDLIAKNQSMAHSVSTSKGCHALAKSGLYASRQRRLYP